MLRHRVLLIDDETLARRRLRQLLADADDFDVVGECADSRQAAESVLALRPDVAFLDIRMPHLDGFDVQRAIRTNVRHVVFVSAHSQHAARAFDVAAFDYLVKPVTSSRFRATLDRLRKALSEPGVERILLGNRRGGTSVDVHDISWLQADGAYVVVHVGARTHVLRESVTQIIDRLGAHSFIRIHRSVGINLAHVRGLKQNKLTGLEVELKDGTRLPISRRKAGVVVALLRGRGQSASGNTSEPLIP